MTAIQTQTIASSQTLGEEIPAVAAAFAPAASADEAEAYTSTLAKGHYENFSVLSLLLPKHLRQDFCNVYAFCRLADDLGDAMPDTASALTHLDRFKEKLRACYAGQADTAVFLALARTIQRHDIPIEPFADLIDAFEQDQRVTRYETFDQLVDYCRRSANPVGRLVLYMCGYRDEQRQALSDYTCTALQLANFWQDVQRDLADLDRIYLPAESMQKFGVTESQLREGREDQHYRDLVRFEVDRTNDLFMKGGALLPLLDDSVRGHISLFARGGQAVLDAIRRCNYNTLSGRPSLSAWQKGKLIAAACAAGLQSRRAAGSISGATSGSGKGA